MDIHKCKATEESDMERDLREKKIPNHTQEKKTETISDDMCQRMNNEHLNVTGNAVDSITVKNIEQCQDGPSVRESGDPSSNTAVTKATQNSHHREPDLGQENSQEIVEKVCTDNLYSQRSLETLTTHQNMENDATPQCKDSQKFFFFRRYGGI